MASITGKNKSGPAGAQVLDGSDIRDLVENEEVFSNFVDHKFQELDRDCDGKLSVRELQPAVADIGAALGLPAKGSSPDSDNIYTEVPNSKPPLLGPVFFFSLCFSLISTVRFIGICLIFFNQCENLLVGPGSWVLGPGSHYIWPNGRDRLGLWGEKS